MRKILGRKFWSLGTPLGSLGPLSQGDVIVGPYGLQILVIWGPYEPPVLVACQATAENPKSVGSWCASFTTFRKVMQHLTYLLLFYVNSQFPPNVSFAVLYSRSAI